MYAVFFFLILFVLVFLLRFVFFRWFVFWLWSVFKLTFSCYFYVRIVLSMFLSVIFAGAGGGGAEADQARRLFLCASFVQVCFAFCVFIHVAVSILCSL